MSLAPLTEPLAPGVHRIAVPTPFAVGDVNCYLLTGDPLTLIDTGPNSGTGLDRLERALAEHALRIEDLELIVLTHQHMDHEGLLEILQRRSGAEVAALAALAPWLAEYPGSARADDAYAQAIMRRHGIPDDINTLLGVLSAGLHSYGSGGALTRRLQDGDRITLGGREYHVHHRPGHSPSDIVLFEPESGVLLAGDHLLGHISSNALVSRPLEGGVAGPRPTPLIDYSRSLRATATMPIRVVAPGHGETITDPAALIATRLRDQERRARKILSLIGEQARTAHEIAQQMWGEIAIKQAYLTLSEVLGHLDLLLTSGAARETEVGGVSRFAAN
ncbi:MAG TPA: MBL fold metallo-hydrolase [Solirubrobacteraceae bacterium]|nr:MBL fold metallo-hydrolase [Solirubrobacteraceae bacterium]